MINPAELNATVRGVLQRLRIPCARSVSLRYHFNLEHGANPGITVVFPDREENVIAPGDGKVIDTSMVQPKWTYTPGTLHMTQGSFQVVIEHGPGVRTVTHGMRTCSVHVGQQIKRGQVLGLRTDKEVFFALVYLDHPFNPIGLNRHFRTQNGSVIVGQGGFLRFAPDFSVRDLANGIVSTLVNGYRYFVPATCSVPSLLIDIDFNGNGSKTGFAVDGILSTDYWNVYTPIDFKGTQTQTPIAPTTPNYENDPPLYTWLGGGAFPPLAGCSNTNYVDTPYYWGIFVGQNPNGLLSQSQIDCHKAIVTVYYDEMVAANPLYQYTKGQYFWYPVSPALSVLSAFAKTGSGNCDPNDPTGNHVFSFDEAQGLAVTYCRVLKSEVNGGGGGGGGNGGYSSYGCSGLTFNADPVVRLLDYLATESPIWFERQAMVADHGNTSWFDPMLSTWSGGYSGGMVPFENSFSLRSVPPGNYVLYLYANEGTSPNASTFFVSVDAGSPTVKSNAPINISAFVDGVNYVQYALTLAAISTIHVKALGFLAGVQLKRT